MSSDVPCPSCGAQTGIEFNNKTETFRYGVTGPKQVTLVARVTFGSCAACKFEWTDHTAELAKSEAIVRHLQDRVTELERRLGISDEIPAYTVA